MRGSIASARASAMRWRWNGGLVLTAGARLHAQAEGDVLEHRHVAEQRVVLEHEADVPFARAPRQRILAIEGNLAGIGPVEAGDDAQQRGLAGTGRTEQRQQLAIVDLEIDAIEGFEATELLDEIPDFNGHLRRVLRRGDVRERSWRST
jgi:hypothetical protein